MERLEFSVKKTQFFDKYKDAMNRRQTKATATRDLQELVKIGVLKQNPAGRSTNYELNISS